MNLSVREIEERDIPSIQDYWLESDDAFLEGMGVDLSKLPSRRDLRNMLMSQISQGYEEKNSYCTIWENDGQSVGHCNVGDLEFGKEANLHLHLWHTKNRKHGAGLELLRLSLPYFFNNLKLKNLFSEPYALNPAPNKTLEKLGFEFVKEYETIPGSLNFMQTVKRWVLSKAMFEEQYGY